MNSLPGSEKFAVKTTELTRRFGDLTAVDHIDLRIRHGEIFGLLGANGAGKSTMVKMLTTLLPPTSGSAEVDGFDIAKFPGEVRRRIGYVPQLVSADGALTGYENLRLSAKLYGLPGTEMNARIADALDFMGLTDSARKLVRTYSGGMVRRLELAQAMLHRPAILFLDEPTIGLDPVARHSVWDRLRDLKRDYSMTVLITTHDMEEAEALCDELAILHAGRIAVVGKPAALRETLGVAATMDDVFAPRLDRCTPVGLKSSLPAAALQPIPASHDSMAPMFLQSARWLRLSASSSCPRSACRGAARVDRFTCAQRVLRATPGPASRACPAPSRQVARARP